MMLLNITSHDYTVGQVIDCDLDNTFRFIAMHGYDNTTNDNVSMQISNPTTRAPYILRWSQRTKKQSK